MADLKERIASLSPGQRELLGRRLNERTVGARAGDAQAGGPAEPIAIVGMACRFPAGAGSPEGLWELLAEGRDAVREVPASRWDPASTSDPDVVRRGAFLDPIDRFDAAFFGISPREACSMDPQHRLLLEVGWEALEDAGLCRESLRSSSTGVFAAVYHRDYARLALADPDAVDAYVSSGTHHSMAANRLSYHLDLRGPSFVVDTACSSSLVAVHLACQSLRQHECDAAVAGAANLMLLPEETLAQARLGILAADGRTKTFDARADGFVRGEGCGVLVLQRLADAGGDTVYAVIRGTAVNQDGHSNGLTAPNGEAQQAVIRRALEASGLEPRQITYVETHGTGTRLGDPIEVEAVAEILDDEDGPPCGLGSVKANLGHTEAAAGMASLIKTVLCLRNRKIPPQIHLAEVNPLLPLAGTRFVIPTDLAEWPTGDGARRAGVSSFGIGGTNAHVVLEEAPPVPELPVAPEEGAYLLPFSARAPQALAEMAAALRRRLAASETPLTDLVATAGRRRTHHEYRRAVWGRDRAELCGQLDAVDAGEPIPTSGALVFVFSGQGWQWLGMGERLYAREEVFRDALKRCGAAVGRHTGRDPLAAWRSAARDGRWPGIDLLQPILFALQVALAAQWRAWGVEPDAVIGHSLGEVAAAHVAGALTLEDAALVVGHRSRVLGRLRGGAMAVVELGRDEVEAEIAELAGRLWLAAENGPRSAVLAGDPEALETVLARFRDRGVFCREVAIDVASHSPYVDPVKDDLRAALAGVAPRPAGLPLYSTVSGTISDGTDLDAAYWVRNLRQPVRFRNAVERAVADGHDLFLELAGHPVLRPALEQTLTGGGGRGVALASWRRGLDERGEMLAALGELYGRGIEVDWHRVTPGPFRPARLPTYPWQRRRFWIDAPPSSQTRLPAGPPALYGAARLSLGGARDVHVWQGRLDPARYPFLADHRVQGSVVLPGVAYLGVIHAAAEAAFGPGDHRLREVGFLRPLLLDSPPTVQWTVRRRDAGEATFEGHSQREDGAGTWTLHVRGRLELGRETRPTAPPPRQDEILGRCPRELSGEELYELARVRGNQWGPAFSSVARVHVGAGEALVRVRVAAAVRSELPDHPFHPAVLDACGQPLFLCLPDAEVPSGAFVLAQVEEARLCGRPEVEMWSHLRLRPTRDQGRLRGDIRIFSDAGVLLAELRGLAIDFLDRRETGADLEDDLFSVGWRPAPISSAESPADGVWLLLADALGVGRELDRRLRAGGARTVLVPADEGPEPAIETLGSPATEVRRVVDLRGLAVPGADFAEAGESPAARAARLCAASLEIVRRRRPEAAPRDFWWVTAGAHTVDAGPEEPTLRPPGSPVAAALWGLLRGVAAEHPELAIRLVDLEPGLDLADAARQLERELLHGAGEDQAAWRRGRRYVPRLGAWRLARAAGSPGPEGRLSPGASYLVTGGLGGLGLAVARHFVDRGARRLVLLSRTPLPPREQWRTLDPESPRGRQTRTILELEGRGASVHVAAVDVGNEKVLRSFLETFAAEAWPPIRGVVHAAGVQHPRPALELDAGALEAELAAKVSGGVFLHRLFGAETELDFFVLFSSAATLLPSPLLAAYTAANAALAEIAHERRRLGLPALAVDWGVWSRIGLGERRRAERARDPMARGIRSLSPARALAVLERLMGSEQVRVAVLPIDWRAWSSAYPAAAATPFLKEIVRSPDGKVPTDGVRDNGARPDLDALRDAPLETRREVIGAYLRARLASVLRTSPEQVPVAIPLTSLGLDSLMAIELRNRIRSELGTEIPIIRLLGSPGLRHLVDEVLPRSPRPAELREMEEWTI